MFAVAEAPPRTASDAASDARTVTDPRNREFVSGVNCSPALPSATVMNAPSAIGVVAVVLEERPAGDGNHLEVRHLGAVRRVARHDQAGRGLRVDGSDRARDGWRSATGVTEMVAVTGLPPRPASEPAIDAWALNWPEAKLLAAGMNLNPAAPCAAVTKVPLATVVTASARSNVPPENP